MGRRKTLLCFLLVSPKIPPLIDDDLKYRVFVGQGDSYVRFVLLTSKHEVTYVGDVTHMVLCAKKNR